MTRVGWGKGAVALGVAAIVYFLCLRFGFPGYFHPTAPFHPDLFIGQGFRARPHFWIDALHLPRPAGFLAIRAMAEFGLAGSLVVVIGLSLLNVALLSRLVARVTGTRVSPLLLAAYAALLFAQPQFYFNHRHDALAILSCTWLLLSWHAWYTARRRGVQGGKYFAAWALCTALVCFTKETYMLAGLLFCVWQVWDVQPERRRLAILAAGLFVLLMGLAMWHNRNANSPFVNVKNDAASPYYMSFAPASLLHGMLFYLGKLWTWPAAVLVLAGIVLRRQMLPMVLLLAGTLAFLTHAVLPNHLDVEYAWAGALLSFAPLLFLPRTLISYGAALVFAGVALWLYRPAYAKQQWAVEQEQINRATLASYDRVRAGASGRVLVTGLQSPFQPFLVGDYVADTFGRDRATWLVAVPRGASLKSDATIQPVLIGSVEPSQVDHVLGYDEQGRLIIDATRAQLQFANSDVWRIPELQPHLTALQNNPQDFYALLKAGALYWDWGMTAQAKEFLTRAQAASDAKNGYPAYFLGQIAEHEQDREAAKRYYQQAIAADQPTPNPAFVGALRKLN